MSVALSREYLEDVCTKVSLEIYCLDIHLLNAAINLLFSFSNFVYFYFVAFSKNIKVVKRREDINNWPEISGFMSMRDVVEKQSQNSKDFDAGKREKPMKCNESMKSQKSRFAIN